MERLALITIILPFVGAFIVGLNKKHFAQIATVFAALATLGTLLVAGQWFADGHQSVTYDIVAFDKTAIFGVTLDAVSTLIAFAVVALGFLICLYSCGYLTDKNREHPHNGLPRFYAFLLIFIGAMAGLVYSSSRTIIVLRNYWGMFLGINQLLPNTKSSSSRNESLDYHPRGGNWVIYCRSLFIQPIRYFLYHCARTFRSECENHRVIRCDVCCVG